ncbi:PilW family protein [Thiohalobacter sp. IOR34]|uniref:PilW family protein n=1 Tax=Thiohalobacter sp. IOR34 TaxID=3057176 RepID=UPI0025B0D929|nr:PilW family protein [Thiohalobacter sp. IOR34]WJW75091.1 PilW family protein [Thiohalobacter sp. IOR34]
MNRNRHTADPRQQGLTLVELMIAMTISLLLLGGVIQIFLSNKQTYRVQEGLSRVQENTRFAFSRISRDIRMVGFQGCSNLEQITPNIIASPPITLNLSTIVNGLDNVGSGNAFGALAGTDTITLRSGSPSTVQLTGNMTADNANIQISSNPDNFAAGDYLFITDCAQADLFRATSVSSGSGMVTIAHANNMNTTNRLSKPYQTDAMLMRLNETSYFVRDTGATDQSGNPIYGLYLRSGIGAAATDFLLVDGIQDLQITYGVNSDDSDDYSVDSYESAATLNTNSAVAPNTDRLGIADWSDVVSVRLSILAHTLEDVSPQTQPYSFNGTTVNNPGDRRLRRSFTTTITLRNRTS